MHDSDDLASDRPTLAAVPPTRDERVSGVLDPARYSSIQFGFSSPRDELTLACNRDGLIVYASPEVAVAVGATLSQFAAGSRQHVALPRDLLDSLEKRLKLALPDTELESSSFTVKPENGTTEYGCTMRRLRVTDGTADTVVFRIRCLTASESSPAAPSPDPLYGAIFDTAAIGMVVADYTGRLVRVNRAFAEMLGYAEDEMVGKRVTEFTHPEDVHKTVKHIQELATGQHDRRQMETRYLHRDGISIHARITVNLLRGQANGAKVAVVTVQDISERKKAEDALRASEARYRTIFNAVNDAIAIFDPVSGVILDANQKTIDLSGFDGQEIHLLPLDAISADGAPYAQQEYLRSMIAAAAERPQVFEWLAKNKDGVPGWVEVNLRQAEVDGVPRMVAVVREIGDRKRNEDERARLANHVQLLLDSTGGGIAGIDTEGVCTFVNRSGAQLLGYSPEEIVGQKLHDLIGHTREDGSACLVSSCRIVSAARTGESIRIDGEFFSRRGEGVFPVGYSCYPMVQNGVVQGVVLSFADVTERKQAEEERARLNSEVRRRAAELDATISSMVDGVVIVDHGGEVVRTNLAANNLLELPVADLGMTLRELLEAPSPVSSDGESAAPRVSPVANVLAGAPSDTSLLALSGRNEKMVWVSMSAAPIRDDDGRLLGAVVGITDVTKVHDLQDQQADLIRAMSHDLRTPLTVILGHAQIISMALAGSRKYGRRKESSDAIVVAARQMNSMIRDLVDSARLESHELELFTEPVEVGDQVKTLLSELAGAWEVERIKLDAPKDCPPVKADPDRLRRILSNLISNALKYSEPSTAVDVRVWPWFGEVITSVSDRGAGIRAEDLPKLFKKFGRTEQARGRRDSVGLGLYITRGLIEAHGGRIWVESEVGKGTTFFFALPEFKDEGATASNVSAIGQASAEMSAAEGPHGKDARATA